MRKGFLIGGIVCILALFVVTLGASVRRDHTLAATTSAVSWTFFEGDNFDLERLTLKFDSAPTTNENVVITKDSVQGAAYDTILAAFDPAGYTDVVVTGVSGMKAGDKILVTYLNSDGNSITGVATLLLGQDMSDADLAIFLDGQEVGGTMTLATGDAKIGAVELQDATAATRASIEAANTARTTGTIVLATQHVDADGDVLDSSDLDDINTKIPAQGTAAMAASLPMTVATDDTMFTALDTAVDIVAGDTTSLDSKTPSKGTAIMTGSWPMTIATDDTMFTALDTAVDLIQADTTSLDGKTPALGTATMTGSWPMTIATDDTMFTALDTAVDVIAADTTSIDGKTPAQGTAAMAASWPVTIATDDTMFTALDTAVDIIAGDTTSMDGKMPALGSAAMAASSPVTIASDDTLTTAIKTAVELLDDTVFAEDSAHGDTNKGIQFLAVRNDAGGSLAGATGDYQPLTTDSQGRLWVNDPVVETAINIINGAVQAQSGVISGNSGMIAGIEAKTIDSNPLPNLVSEGDMARLAGSTSGIAYTTLTDPAGLSDLGTTIAGDTTSLDGKTPSQGTAVMTGSWPMTIATDDTMFTALDTAVDIVAGDTTSLDTKTPSQGTAVMAGSWPVTIATDDTMITALDTAIDLIQGDTTSIDGKTASLGTAAMAGSTPVTIATDDTMITALDTAIDIIAGDTTSMDGKITACNTGAVTISSALPAGSNTIGKVETIPGTVGSGYEAGSDSSFVTGDSPAVIDVNNDLGRNGMSGYFVNDGDGDINIKISNSGAVSTEDAILLKANDVFSLDGKDVDQIQVLWVADSAYRYYVE